MFVEIISNLSLLACFCGSPDGVCISFVEDDLKEVFKSYLRVEYKDVEYLSITQARERWPFDADELKFVKRSRYKPEKETRVVFTDKCIETKFPSANIVPH